MDAGSTEAEKKVRKSHLYWTIRRINDCRLSIRTCRIESIQIISLTVLPLILLGASLFFKKNFWLIWGVTGQIAMALLMGFMLFCIKSPNELLGNSELISKRKKELRQLREQEKQIKTKLKP